MTDLDRLMTVDISRAAAEAIEPPNFAAIERRAVQRRWTRASLVAGAAAVAVAIVTVGTSLVGGTGDRAPAPAPEPTISESSSPSPPSRTPDQVKARFAALSPEEIRNHPDAKLLRGIDDRIEVTAAPGVGARIWSVCLDICAPGDDHTWVDGTLQLALELTRDGFATSTLHEFSKLSSVSHVIDDTFVVTGQVTAGGEPGYALLDVSGSRQALTEGATLPVTDIAGPLVFTGQPYAWVDLETLELHAIEGAGGTWETDGAADVWPWRNIYFVTNSGKLRQHGLTWRNPDGTFDVRMLPIEYDRSSVQLLEAGTPGTMAAVDPNPPGLVHVSTDYGATWQVRIIPPDVERNQSGWLEESTLPDDWQSWTTS